MNKISSKPVSKFEIDNEVAEENNNLGKMDEIDEKDDENMDDHFSDYQELNKEQKVIANWLENLKFRKQLVGGVSEYDVWKKIIELNAMYEGALKAERIRCDIIIDYYKDISKSKEAQTDRKRVEDE